MNPMPDHPLLAAAIIAIAILTFLAARWALARWRYVRDRDRRLKALLPGRDDHDGIGA